MTKTSSMVFSIGLFACVSSTVAQETASEIALQESEIALQESEIALQESEIALQEIDIVLQEGDAVQGQDGEPDTGTLDAREVEAFIDGYMASYLKQANIAGASVAVVQGEDLVLAKGYGYADVDARIRVDPETTLFRIGSVSKLFVWTAVMQLVEDGRLDLDADLNTYLTDWTIPEAIGSPVTMAQLMTHTAGFDERALGLFAADETALAPLRDILREELPGRVRPAGNLSSYSNHGTALAMYVVEQITGDPWNIYIEQNILEPLGMDSTTFRQPLPAALAPQMSNGYRFTDGEHVAAPFEFVPLAPVGAAASSATDMARFLSAHLELGRYRGPRILEAETARRMQTTLFRHHPSVNGMAHGFMELEWNGRRIVGHGGDTELFHTLFAFFPDEGIGLFAAFNTVGANYMQFLEAFVDWRFPPESDTPEVQELSGLERFAGVYRPSRYAHNTIIKLAALAGSIEVQAEEDHLVTPGPEKRRWYPVGPLLFQEARSSATIAFRETDDGRITHLFFTEIPILAFERPPLTERPGLVSAILGGGFGIMVMALLAMPASAFMRWRHGVHLAREERVPALGRWSAWLGALALVTFTLVVASLFSDPIRIVYGVPPGAGLAFWLPLIGILLTLVATWGMFQAWRQRRGSLPGRAAFTLLVISMGLFLWQLGVWNFVGFRY